MMSQKKSYHAKPTAHQGIFLLLAFAAAILLVPGPALCQQNQQDSPRQDETMGTTGTPGRVFTGTNERGDNVVQVQPAPKTTQEMPNVGPIYVVPQVNPSGTSQGTILPTPSTSSRVKPSRP